MAVKFWKLITQGRSVSQNIAHWFHCHLEVLIF